MRKKYCDLKSGSADGWDKKGRQVFARLCKKVQTLREDPETGQNLEKMMLERFKSEKIPTVSKDGGTVASSLAEEENEDDNFIDPILMQLLGQLEELSDAIHNTLGSTNITPAKQDNWAIHLRPHWQYAICKLGEQQSHNCCDGSKRPAPLLNTMTNAYSSRVEQSIQHLVLALSTIHNNKLFAGDVTDAFVHSPAPDPTLTGRPESGRLWEEHINHILTSSELNFKSTVHNKYIYQTTFDNNKILLLCQVDKFLVSCNNETTTIKIYNIIGKCLQHTSKHASPFKYLGLATYYNDATNTELQQSHPTPPLPDKALNYIYINPGPLEGTNEHLHPQTTHGFSYCTLPGELCYAYTTCCPDIGFSLSNLSKFSTPPAPIHYKYIKGIAFYLCCTKHWGPQYQQSTMEPHTDLPPVGTFSDSPIPFPPELPTGTFPSLPTGPIVTCFFDAACVNACPCHKSTSRIPILLANAVIIYKLKTKTQTTLSSTEAKFYTAVSAAKLVLYYLQSVLLADLDTSTLPDHHLQRQQVLDPVCIKLSNNSCPTKHSCHILIVPYSAVHEWTEHDLIHLTFIEGKINPAGALTKPLAWVLHSSRSRTSFRSGSDSPPITRKPKKIQHRSQRPPRTLLVYAGMATSKSLTALEKSKEAVLVIKERLAPVLQRLTNDAFGEQTGRAQASVALSIGMMRYMGARLRGLDQGRNSDDPLRKDLNNIKRVLAKTMKSTKATAGTKTTTKSTSNPTVDKSALQAAKSSPGSVDPAKRKKVQSTIEKDKETAARREGKKKRRKTNSTSDGGTSDGGVKSPDSASKRVRKK
eukprot:jgi/Psemu1/22499/gm1.22499_g